MDFAAGVVLCFALTPAVDANRVYIRFVSGAADDNHLVPLHLLSFLCYNVRASVNHRTSVCTSGQRSCYRIPGICKGRVRYIANAIRYCVFVSFCYRILRVAIVADTKPRSSTKGFVPRRKHCVYWEAPVAFKKCLVLMGCQRCGKFFLHKCALSAALTSSTDFHGVCCCPPPLGFDATIRSCHE